MKIYYHNDSDGLVSAAIALIKWPDAETVPIQHGDQTVFPENEEIAFLDYTPPKNRFPVSNPCVTWIDHHDSAFDNGPADTPGIRRVTPGQAGCWLTWEYCCPNMPPPPFVEAVSYYDTWHKTAGWDHFTLPTERALRLRNITPQQLKPILSCDTFYRHLLTTGRPIVRYDNQRNKALASRYAYTARTASGHYTLAMNHSGDSSVLDPILHEYKVDFITLYRQRPDRLWQVSFFAGTIPDTTAHCGEIAASYGGGGRKDAAGCVVESMEEVLL